MMGDGSHFLLPTYLLPTSYFPLPYFLLPTHLREALPNGTRRVRLREAVDAHTELRVCRQQPRHAPNPLLALPGELLRRELKVHAGEAGRPFAQVEPL